MTTRRPPHQHSAGGVVISTVAGVRMVAAIRPAGRAGVWALPKGGLDPGETAEQAALREVREETGLRCRTLRPLPEVRYFFTRNGRPVAKLVEFWEMEPTGGAIDDLHPSMRREVDEARWLPLDEAPELLTYAGERRLLAAIRDGDGDAT